MTKRNWERRPQSYVFNSLSWCSLGPITIGANSNPNQVTAAFQLTTQCKIAKVGITLTGIDSLNGNDFFNLVVGFGTYETTGAQGSGTVTLGGTPTNGDVVKITLNGVEYDYTGVTTGHTLTQTAAETAAFLNGIPSFAAIAYATPAAAVITITSNVYSASGNYTLVASATGGHTTATASGAALTGGTATTGFVTAANDNSYDQNLPGGVGISTNVAVQGNALFGTDVGFNASNAYNGTTGVGWGKLATATGGYGIFVPDNYDAVYPRHLPITLRVNTPASTGSITGLCISLLCEPITFRQNWDSNPTGQLPNPIVSTPVPGRSF